MCGGIQLHVTDRNVFKPVVTAVVIISAIYRLYPDKFGWKEPPYEYVYDKLPFDVINGTARLRQQIEAGTLVSQIESEWAEGLARFNKQRVPYLLYEE